jgi:hypothetical protein
LGFVEDQKQKFYIIMRSKKGRIRRKWECADGGGVNQKKMVRSLFGVASVSDQPFKKWWGVKASNCLVVFLIWCTDSSREEGSEFDKWWRWSWSWEGLLRGRTNGFKQQEGQCSHHNLHGLKMGDEKWATSLRLVLHCTHF